MNDPISPTTTKIGWIGTGVMGTSMCGHLLKAGYACTIYNRTGAKAEALASLGNAAIVDDPGKVGFAADITFLMVGYPADVRGLVFGEDGLLKHMRPGSILVDMTTSQPSLAVEIFNAVRARNIDSLDAPVSGGDIGAREARLSIMVGGDRRTLHRVQPLFNLMGKTIMYQGPAGCGQHTKMVNQTLIATGIIGVCEALLYAFKAGLDIETVLQSVSGGAAGSWSLTNYAPRMLKGNFDPGFFVEHFIKDMDIALGEASRMRLALPGLALARQLYEALRAQGGEKKGIHALLLALAKLSDVEWKTIAPTSP